MEEVFYEYVKKYDLSIVEIDNKYHHSLRVRDLCGEIANHLGLSEEDITLARQIGLLHDIGRFEQWKKYKSYNDAFNIDHGDLGVKILFDDEMIDKFGITDNLDIIYKTIKYHNKFEVPKFDERTSLFCKIIRDADKVDILYLISNNEYNTFNNDNEPVSMINKEDFYGGRLVKNKNRKNMNDSILAVLSFIYDFNFDISKEHILEYLRKLYDGLKYKEPLKEFFEKIGVIKC